jgi:nicotinate-nucleotide adenylyltransferase
VNAAVTNNDTSTRAAGDIDGAPAPESLHLSLCFEAAIAAGIAAGRGADGAEPPLRLGILGGTFDPIHLGHLHIAEQAYEQYGLLGVLFLPTGRPAWKLDREVTSAEDRFAMVAAAIADNPHFAVSRLEIDRPGVTYTQDTLATLQATWEDAVEMCFIVGADSARDLANWRGAREIARMVTVLVAGRPGTEDYRQAQDFGFAMRPIDTVPLDISSSELRKLAAAGLSLRYVVPEAVRALIAQRDLYRERSKSQRGTEGGDLRHASEGSESQQETDQ